MNDFELTEEEQTKIPYDNEPIARNRVGINSSARKSNVTVGKSLYVLVSILLIITMIMGGFMVKLIINSNKPTVVNNPTYNITVDGSPSATVAANKGKLSTVCVSAGQNTQTGSNITYKTFFTMSSRGSGVIIDVDKNTGDATIITCYHVVENYTRQVYILVYGSYTPVKASVINYSETYDIAVLKVENSSEIQTSVCIAATIGDSSNLVEGDMAIAIGNPLSGGISVSCGIISSPVNIVLIDENESRVIKVDTPINSGNSGGGLFDKEGNLIGIVNAKLMSSEIDNVAFAIPINLAKNLSNSIIRNGSSAPTTAVLGLDLAILSSGNYLDYETGKLNSTIIVESVNTLSASYVAGIRKGDELVSISYGDTFVEIKNLFDIEDHMFNLSIGDKITIVVERDGTELTYNFFITNVNTIS